MLQPLPGAWPVGNPANIGPAAGGAYSDLSLGFANTGGGEGNFNLGRILWFGGSRPTPTAWIRATASNYDDQGQLPLGVRRRTGGDTIKAPHAANLASHTARAFKQACLVPGRCGGAAEHTTAKPRPKDPKYLGAAAGVKVAREKVAQVATVAVLEEVELRRPGPAAVDVDLDALGDPLCQRRRCVGVQVPLQLT